MNENIDLTKILKNCPKGTKLYSTIFGTVNFDRIKKGDEYPIVFVTIQGDICNTLKDGRYYKFFDGECTLFPSKDQRDWSKFTAPWLEKQGDSLRVNDRAWLYLVSDVLTWKDGVGQYLDDPRVQELAKRLCSEYAQKLYNHSVISNASNTGKNEQKSDDKIESRFKVGDWIISSVLGTARIIGVNNSNEYQLEYIDGKQKFSSIDYVNYAYNKWTINDAKEGDVLALSLLEDENIWEKIIIFKKYHSEGVKGLCGMPCVEGYGNTIKNRTMELTEDIPYYSKKWTCNLYPATKEQRDLLFKKIKKAGYKWNAETKTLEKLVEVPDKFDPKTLKAFDMVLVRNFKTTKWRCEHFSYFDGGNYNPCIASCCSYTFCIPYNEETKHLVGTTEEAPEYYRYWED